MDIKIDNLKRGLVKGIKVQMPNETNAYEESYFNWEASRLKAQFNTTNISGGILKAWKHKAEFSQVETHSDAEMFYFCSGTALMLFVDLIDGKPDMNTAQIVRIEAGTQIIISEGKGHFVPVAENDAPVNIVVVSPIMDASRLNLPEMISAL